MARDFSTPSKGVCDGFQLLQPLDVVFEVFTRRARTGALTASPPPEQATATVLASRRRVAYSMAWMTSGAFLVFLASSTPSWPTPALYLVGQGTCQYHATNRHAVPGWGQSARPAMLPASFATSMECSSTFWPVAGAVAHPAKQLHQLRMQRMHRSGEGCPEQSAGSARLKRRLRPTRRRLKVDFQFAPCRAKIKMRRAAARRPQACPQFA